MEIGATTALVLPLSPEIRGAEAHLPNVGLVARAWDTKGRGGPES